MRGIRLIFGFVVGIGAVLALLTSFIVFGYVIKIVGFLLALVCVLAFVIFLIWAAIKEFVFDAKKKPPE